MKVLLSSSIQAKHANHLTPPNARGSSDCPPHCCPQVELSDGTSHTITDAYAGKEYIIQVAAKDNDIGTWSDWSVAVHATPWTEEPKHLTTEAQITGETPSSSTVVPHSGGGPGVTAEGPTCPFPASLFPSQGDTPSTWRVLQHFTLHFAPHPWLWQQVQPWPEGC